MLALSSFFWPADLVLGNYLTGTRLFFSFLVNRLFNHVLSTFAFLASSCFLATYTDHQVSDLILIAEQLLMDVHCHM